MNSCPHCGTELLCYTSGRSYGLGTEPEYPYENGMYCPNWRNHSDKQGSWSNLEISQGALERKK
jgi:hypothetical protein